MSVAVGAGGVSVAIGVGVVVGALLGRGAAPVSVAGGVSVAICVGAGVGAAAGGETGADVVLAVRVTAGGVGDKAGEVGSAAGVA